MPRPILLIGSFPFKTADEVFHLTGPLLAGYAKYLPDGEAQGWAPFAGATLARTAGLEPSDQEVRPGNPALPPIRQLRLTEGTDACQLEFPAVGYDRIALRSYARFTAARAAGLIQPGSRFQVSLPTPWVVGALHLVPRDVRAVFASFEEPYLRELDSIVNSIPAEDLAIQWDIAGEVTIQANPELSPVLAAQTPPEFLADATARLANRVPRDVALGLHFCYGNRGGRHTVQPTDTGIMVTFANRILERTRRPVNWLHMPVPQDRHDAAYFAPLRDLDLPIATDLYLGLVHLKDGLEGSKRRLEAAKPFVPHPTFGVAWECGLRYFSPESIGPMLELHKAAANLE